MIIEPMLPDFQYLMVTRSGGLAGATQTLKVDQHLRAAVTDTLAGARLFTLDARIAQELMASLALMAARHPAASAARGCDLFHYDIELAWGGNVYVVHSVDIGAGEALHGVIMAANNLMAEPESGPVRRMTLHSLRSS